MSNLISVLFICLAFGSFGQVYFDSLPLLLTSTQNIANFTDVFESATDLSDVDNDGDLDVLITGMSYNSLNSMELYLNDGFGSFTTATSTSFEAIREGDLQFVDIDGDADEDIFLMGQLDNGVVISKFYLNDGLGNFTESISTIDSLRWGSMDFGDIDGDADFDLIISGYSNAYGLVTKLFSNDGLGNFTESTDSVFTGMSQGDLKFVDLDNDADLDLLVFGFAGSGGVIGQQFENDGFGNFILDSNAIFTETMDCRLALGDMDNDGDTDLMTLGSNDSGLFEVLLYENDGNGSLTVSPTTFLSFAADGDITVADIDLDGDLDVMYTGRVNYGVFMPATRMFVNQGGIFEERTACVAFPEMWIGTTDFFDADNDGDPDLLVTGKDGTTKIKSRLFINSGEGCFSQANNSPYFGCYKSSTSAADIDADGDIDILFTGASNSALDHTVLYKNDGSGAYVEEVNNQLMNISSGDAIFFDADNDLDQDILISGLTIPDTAVSLLYSNDGTGNYSLVLGTPFEGMSTGSILAIDADQDGDDDILFTGESDTQPYAAAFYENQGGGNFLLSANAGIQGCSFSSSAKGDVDNDGDLDLIVTGWTSLNTEQTILYLNNGNGVFSEAASQFSGVRFGDCEFSDIDNDGDLDLFIVGYTGVMYRSDFYLNDGSGNFQLDVLNTITGVSAEAEFIDFEGDLDEDLVVVGWGDTRLYVNDGTGVFTESSGHSIVPFGESLEHLDLDLDGDQDLLITGQTSTGELFARLYQNRCSEASLSELDQSVMLDVFPNPSEGTFTLVFNEVLKEALVLHVTDLRGNQIETLSVNDGVDDFPLDMSSFTSGMYLLSLEYKGRNETLRLQIID